MMTLTLPVIERRLFVDFLIRWLETNGYHEEAQRLTCASPPPRDEIEALAFVPSDVEIQASAQPS